MTRSRMPRASHGVFGGVTFSALAVATCVAWSQTVLFPARSLHFDGKSLAGWVEGPAMLWSVVEGTLDGKGTTRGQLLMTDEDYRDFRVIVKLENGGRRRHRASWRLFLGRSLARGQL